MVIGGLHVVVVLDNPCPYQNEILAIQYINWTQDNALKPNICCCAFFQCSS